MSLSFRRTVRLGRRTTATVSKRGVSASLKLGRVTVSTTGRVSVRLARGLSWRGGAR